MARIPDTDIERLKRELSLLRLLESQGHRLVRQGKDWACRCPWHEGDDTPSCVITVKSNLWHCFGCDVGGSVIDWVMRSQRVSFRHACELLLKESPVLSAPVAATKLAAKPNGYVRPAADWREAEDDARALDEVIGYYHETLLQSPEALAYLDQRGLHDAALIARFRLGFANRTLGYRLPPKASLAGAAARGQLQRVGILRESGHEHFNGSLVVPVFDAAGHVVEAYGRKIVDNLRAGTAKHLYLPGPHRGVFNRAGIEGQEEVILCEALIDALSFVAAGIENVTSAYGVNGVTDELLAVLTECGAKRVLIAFDRDEAGDRAAAELAPRLQALGLDVFRLQFPKGMDANAYALQVKPAAKSLGVVIRSAVWLGNGVAPAITTAAAAPAVDTDAPAAAAPAPMLLPSAAAVAVETSAQAEPSPPTLPPRAVGETPEPETPCAASEREVVIVLGDRRYRVRGLRKNSSHEVMKINLLVNSPAGPSTASGQGLHVDTLDLYAAKARQQFARQAAAELGVEESAIQRDLGRVLLKLEELQDQFIQAALKPKAASAVEMAKDDEAAALALLRAPDLAARIVADVEASGLIGEPGNALIGYLAMVSRKLPAPLAILIQSTSAAGKSALMDALLRLVPEEDRIHYSAMTGQSLFYLGERDLKHKILAIAEEEGVRQAAYALKLLQSQGELTIASTGKDPATGLLTTQEYRVEGPVMLCLTTTAIDVDEELQNRCLTLTIDESRAQTRAIQAAQRRQRTLEGLLAESDAAAIVSVHRNAQRLLRPLKVVNPYAEQLSFVDERTRTRRDHAKYLSLIDAIALLHQHQREVKHSEHRGKVIEYVEVTAQDIALANRLAHEVLGRSLDELPPQTRRLLATACAYVAERMQTQSLQRSEVRFTRRELRECSGLSNTQLGVHLERLLAMEYLIAHRGARGQSYVYELVFDGDADAAAPHLPGLIDVAELHTAATTTASSRGGESELTGSLRPQNGVKTVGLRMGSKARNPCTDAASGDLDADGEENAPIGSVNGKSCHNALAATALSLAAASAVAVAATDRPAVA
jgi:DNA primase catalytic core